MQSTRLPDRIRARIPLPQGALSISVGLVLHGVAAYGFLALSARKLGQEDFTPLGVLWSMVFLVGPGVFIPLEQELARAISVRRAQGDGVGPVVRRAAVLGAAAAGLLVLATVGFSGPVLDHFLRNEEQLLVAFVLGVVGYLVGHLTRGLLAGLGRFRPYAVYLAGEGIVRLVIGLVLVAGGSAAVGPYGLAVGIAPFIAALIAVAPEDVWEIVRSDGSEAPWTELSKNLGALLAGSVLSLALVYAGPVAVEWLAGPGEEGEAGAFVAGLVIARVPFFLFQGIQGALLPRLATMAGAGQWVEFRSALGQLLRFVSLLGVLAVVAAALIGPGAVGLLFGEEFELGRRSMTMLAIAVAVYILAMSLAQALISIGSQRAMAAGWGMGVLVFGMGLAVGNDLLWRVELGLVAGSTAAALVMGWLLTSAMHRTGLHVDRREEGMNGGVVPGG